MHTEPISQVAELEAIADGWNELALPSPMQSPDWLIPWWQVFGGANRELAVLTIRADNGCLLGLCPWYLEARPMGRCLRWLGDGLICSDHASILLSPRASRADVLPAVIDWLCHCQTDRLSRMTLESVDSDDVVFGSLLAGMQQQGWLLTERAESGSSWIELPSSWDEYLGTISKNHRKRCRRWHREFFETGRACVRVASNPADCCQAFEQLISLHNQRRRSAGRRGAFEDADFCRFHRLAVSRLARRGRLQLRLLSVDHELLAVEYVLVDSAAVYAYQSGLSAPGEAVSAGNLSVLSLIRDAIDQGRRRVDLLRGTEPYKFSWGAIHRTAQTRVLRRRSVAGVLQACLDNALQGARSWKNSTAGLHRKRLSASQTSLSARRV